MRKLIVTNIVSLDGDYEGPGGNVMALPMDGAFDAYCAERLATADILLLGRNSFGLFSGFWPPVADNPDAKRAIARRDNEIDKVVVSDTLTADQTGVWQETTQIVPRERAHATIAELKDAPGSDILVFAAAPSGTTCSPSGWSTSSISSSAPRCSAAERRPLRRTEATPSPFSTPGALRARATSCCATPRAQS